MIRWFKRSIGVILGPVVIHTQATPGYDGTRVMCSLSALYGCLKKWFSVSSGRHPPCSQDSWAQSVKRLKQCKTPEIARRMAAKMRHHSCAAIRCLQPLAVKNTTRPLNNSWTALAFWFKNSANQLIRNSLQEHHQNRIGDKRFKNPYTSILQLCVL